jgi:hypothetical protein
MSITKFQETCKEVLATVVDREGLSQNDKLSAALQAALEAHGGEGREAVLEDIQTILHLAAAAIGAFNLQHLAKGPFKKGEAIDYSSSQFDVVRTSSPIVAEALCNIAFASLLEREHVPNNPLFFRNALNAATRLVGAKAASQLGVAGLSVEEKQATVNQFVGGVYEQAANAATAMLCTQYNTSALFLDQKRLDSETNESIYSEFTEAIREAGTAVAEKWNAYLSEKITTMLAAAKATKKEARQ